MKIHLKTRVFNRLRVSILAAKPLPRTPAQSPNVRYVKLCDAFEIARGVMNTRKEAKHYRKNIILRPSRHRPGLHELYVCRHPKHWSQACIDNRELIKQAQRLAHQIERNHSFTALEWRVRFFEQYFNPAPGETPYPHFYTFVFTSIYRTLRKTQRTQTSTRSQMQNAHIIPLRQALQTLQPTPYYRYPLRAVVSRLCA